MSDSSWYPYLGALALLLGGGAAIFWIVDSRNSGPRRMLERYVEGLDGELRFLMSRTSGRAIARAQLACAVICLLATAWSPYALLALAAVAITPKMWLARERSHRVARIEKQLPGWLLMLSNMLKATGALGDAIAATADLVGGPLGQELDLALKEIRLGASLEQALSAMAARIDSRVISTHVATLLVGRTTGGQLPDLLDQSAASLREMERLDGVVRTQTAQGRAQLFVLVGAPAIIVALFRAVDPGFFEPLINTAVGTGIIFTAVGLWLGALVWARKVLNVDL